MNTIYFDMDGVLADLEELLVEGHHMMYKKGSFLNLKPLVSYNLLDKIFTKIRAKNKKVGVLSIAVKSPYCKEEKMEWLKKYCPSFDEIILLETGDNKADAVDVTNSLLLDDYGKNCYDWVKNGGVAYKIGGNKKRTCHT